MVDRDDLLELAPHYLAMLVVAFAVLTVLNLAFEDLGFIVETAIVVVALLLYRPIVLRLGIAPTTWEDRNARK